MKRIFIALMLAALLAGCAATSYRTARENANKVQNGMTVQQAAAVLGMDPSHQTADLAQWRRGNAQQYNGTAAGAIEFKLQDGKIVDVPEGGVFGPAAFAKFQAEQQERREAAARAKELLAERIKTEMIAESNAIASSQVVCDDKSTCEKAFALAQIYVNRNADQKIQVATDTIIETYNPTEPGKIAITVAKMPRRGSTEVLSIAVICKDSDYESFASLCRLKRTAVYAGFKPFIQASLVK